MNLSVLRHRNARIATGAAALALIAAALVLTLTGGKPAPPPVVAADLSGRPSACLATDQTTATHTPLTTRIWAAVRQAATARPVNLQQLIMPVPTSAQAHAYLAGLIARRCTLIITVGQPFAQAIPALAKADPDAAFTAVGAHLQPTPPHTTLLPADATAPTTVSHQVQKLASPSRNKH